MEYWKTKPVRDPKVIERMRTTLDLYETAEAMMRLNLRRRHPEASEEEIERLLLAWLRKEPVRGPSRRGRSSAPPAE